jgi:Queuine tRNA-ribosyltransferase
MCDEIGKSNSNMNPNRSEPLPAVRIMLHSEDGVVPYLTPDVLKLCFPPDAVWCLGIAVNDTCIVPMYTSDRQKHPKRSKTTNKQERQSDATNQGTKPRGYTFAATASNVLDSWLYPYPRIAVPSFGNETASSTSKSGRDVSNPSAVSVKKTLALWTANGRHSIDSQQYIECATVALRARQVLFLHENLDASQLSVRYEKRKLAVLQQNQFWMQEHKQLLAQQPSVDTFWFPLAVAGDSDFVNNPVDLKHLDWIVDQQSWLSSSSSQKISSMQYGIMLIGWNSIASPRSRFRIFQSLQVQLDEMAESALTVGTISTSSTRQILEWIQFSAHRYAREDTAVTDAVNGFCSSILIGTNLPASWARAKRCFVVDIDLAPAFQVRPLKFDQDGCWDLNRPILANGSCQPVNEHPFYFDQHPLVSNCACRTCTTYSRSYLYHLVCSKELLAEVLLFIHNFHHLLSLIRAVNVYYQEGDLDKITQLCHRIQSQLEESEDQVEVDNCG